MTHEHEQQRAILRFKCKSAILTLKIENVQNCIVDSLFWSELSRTVLSGISAHGIQNIILHIFYPRMKNTFVILFFFILKISLNIFDVISLHTILFSIFFTNILRFAKCMVKSTGLSGFLLLFKDQFKLQLQLKSWDNEEQRDSGHVVHCCACLSVGMMLRQKKQYDRYKDHPYMGN